MITLPKQHEIEELQLFNEPFSLSVYAPYIETDISVGQYRISLKNLLRKARTALLSAGLSPEDAKKTLRPGFLLLEDHNLWPSAGESLVLFMHKKLFRSYYMPSLKNTSSILITENGFYLDPLIKTIGQNQRYFILALSHKNVRLYEGDNYHLRPVHLKNLPRDMKESLRIDEYPSWRETHTIAPASSGRGSEAYHGQYNVKQTDKTMLLEFFRRIDRRLHNFLHLNKSPLILAGVDYLLPIYRKVNSFPSTLPGGIKGNIEHANLEWIRQNAQYLMSKGTAKV